MYTKHLISCAENAESVSQHKGSISTPNEYRNITITSVIELSNDWDDVGHQIKWG